MTELIQHVTLNTGHNNAYSKSECHQDAIDFCKKAIISALDEQKPIPFPVEKFAHISFDCKKDNGALVVTLYAPSGPHIKGKPFNGKKLLPLVVFGIAPSNDQASLWDSLVATYNTIYVENKNVTPQPQTPWLTAFVIPTLSQFMEFIPVIADFERCMGLAWLEILAKGQLK